MTPIFTLHGSCPELNAKAVTMPVWKARRSNSGFLCGCMYTHIIRVAVHGFGSPGLLENLCCSLLGLRCCMKAKKPSTGTRTRTGGTQKDGATRQLGSSSRSAGQRCFGRAVIAIGMLGPPQETDSTPVKNDFAIVGLTLWDL